MHTVCFTHRSTSLANPADPTTNSSRSTAVDHVPISTLNDFSSAAAEFYAVSRHQLSPSVTFIAHNIYGP